MDRIYSPAFWRLFDELDQSDHPSGPEFLYEISDKYLRPNQRVLDVGCRDARHLVRLAQRHQITGLGIDPVEWHIERARVEISKAGLENRLAVRRETAEGLTEPDGTYDIAWCRDVIEVLPDLDEAVRKISRALRRDGYVIAYTNVLAGPIDPAEIELIHAPLGNVVENLVEENVVGKFETNGLSIVERVAVGTQWREYLEERDQVVSRDLLRLARLRRREGRVVASYGREVYQTAQASLQWAVQQFLGRFIPVIYVLRREDVSV